MTKFLIFDAYGTLVELDDFYGRLQRAFEKAGAVLPFETVRRAAQIEMGYYMAHTTSARTESEWIALKKDCARVLSDAIRLQDDSFTLDGARVLRAMEEALVFRVFPEVEEVLQAFQARDVKMAVLSNWDYSLGPIFESLDLARYFQFLLSSSQAGVQKPAREFFDHALEIARDGHGALQSDDCVYVGDHYEGDVIGAREAGMVPVWLVRDERDIVSGEIPADDAVIRIRDLRELLQVI